MIASTLFSIEDCSFCYQKDEVLSNLNFAVKPGFFYGLIGPNGSGKSTLINLLMGTLLPTEGKINLYDKRLEDYRRRDLARHLALVPQEINIGFDFSVYDIVLMGRHPHVPRFHQPSPKDIEIVEHVLELLDITELKQRPVTHLSGGERQRVIVARALAQDTEVLILDEATSNLDIEHTIEILRVLRDKVKKHGKTIVAALHDLNLAAAFCDHLLVLKDAGIYQSGPIEEVLTSHLIEDVFSVKGEVHSGGPYPRIEFDLQPDQP